MAPRGRPPSAQTLVDRQIGRNIPRPFIGESFVMPNHSGVKDFVDTHETVFLKNTTRLTAATTLTTEMEEVFCNTDAAGYIVTLPPGIKGTRYRIINSGTSTNNLTITPNGTEELLRENTSFTLMDKETLVVVFEPTDGWL